MFSKLISLNRSNYYDSYYPFRNFFFQRKTWSEIDEYLSQAINIFHTQQ